MLYIFNSHVPLINYQSIKINAMEDIEDMFKNDDASTS